MAKRQLYVNEKIADQLDNKQLEFLDNFLQNKTKWLSYTLVDIAYILNIVNKSVLKKTCSKDNISKIMDIYQIVAKQSQKVDQNVYFFAMMYVNTLLDDDHTNINLDVFTATQQPLYSGIIINYYHEKDGPIVRVIHSIQSQVKRGDLVTKINNIPILVYLKQSKKMISKRTNASIIGYKKAALLSSIYNPFSPINKLTFLSQNTGKPYDITPKYIKSINGHFGLDKMNIYQYISKYMFESMNEHTEGLNVSKLPEAQLLYFDIHDCPSHGEQLENYMQQASLINQFDWIVVDLRNNLGGSLVELYILSAYLFDTKIVKQLQKCQKFTFITNDIFKKLYYEQYILPLLNDDSISDDLKKQYQEMKTEMKTFNKNVTTEQPTGPCNTNFIQKLIQSTAKNIINEKQHKKVIVILNQTCFSACLWMRGFLSLFPNVITIGQEVGTTNGTGNAVNIPLPSGSGKFVVPQLIASSKIDIFRKKVLNTHSIPDIILDEVLLSQKQALIVYILENKKKLNQLFINKAKHI